MLWKKDDVQVEYLCEEAAENGFNIPKTLFEYTFEKMRISKDRSVHMMMSKTNKDGKKDLFLISISLEGEKLVEIMGTGTKLGNITDFDMGAKSMCILNKKFFDLYRDV